MTNHTKFLVVVALSPILLGVGMFRFAGSAEAAALRAAYDDRPYNDRDLASEYGLKPAGSRPSSGPLGHMSAASDAHKRNNCLEAEASRIQLEYEDKAGMFDILLHPVDARRIARQHFEDQGLIAPGE